MAIVCFFFHFSAQIVEAGEGSTIDVDQELKEESAIDLIQESVDENSDLEENEINEQAELKDEKLEKEGLELPAEKEEEKEIQEDENLHKSSKIDELTNETDNNIQKQSIGTKNAVLLLSNGMYKVEVKDLKIDLAKLGFPVPGNGTPLFGDETERKVKEFQSYFGLQVTGVVDSLTHSKIKEILSTPLQNGQRHKYTVQLKADLASIGFRVPGNGTTLYGTDTTKKVKEFQSAFGLRVNGIADEVTLAKISELKKGPLFNGISREDVKTLKRDLARLGFPVPGKGTALFGNNTEKKVKEFQSYYNLEVTGIVHDTTLAKIDEVLSSPLQNGKRHKDTVQLKKDLATLGFRVPGNGTILFGKDTAKKVREFQLFYGLQVNGIADEVTLAKIVELLEVPLSNGMRREDVKTLKSNLGKLGFAVPGNGTTLFGNDTEKKVREFQSYYNLEVTGIAYETTLAKIEEVLSSSLQNGKRHNDTVQLKANLAKLGFRVPGNGTTLYGKNTTKKVSEFQAYYNLKVNGIADSVTLEQIDAILSSPLQDGKRHEDTVQLKADLAKLGFRVPGNGTTLYGKDTTKKVSEFQTYYKLSVNGIADNKTLEKIEEVLSGPLQNGKRHKNTIKLKENLEILGYKVSNNPTTLYGEKTEQQVRKFQKDHGLPISGIADVFTLEKIDSLIIKVFIDPGHGGKDPGASGYGLQEKNVVLDIALKTAEKLSRGYLGIAVNLSRTTDKFIELEERSRMANDWGSDYFISIHNNAHTGSANGFESFIHNGNVSKETKDMQKKIHEYLINRIDATDRGMKDANFNVLRNTSMPAILIEYLFIDNLKENALLKDKKYRNWLGEITADAIANAFNLKKR